MHNEKNRWAHLMPFFVLAVALVIIFKTLENLSGIGTAVGHFFRVLSPFLLSILIFYFLYKPCIKLEGLFAKSKRAFFQKRARFFSVIIVYLLLTASLILIGALVFPILVNSIIDFANHIPAYLQTLADGVDYLFANNALIDLNIQESIANFTNRFFSDSSNIEHIGRGVISVGTGIFNIVIAVIVSLYIMLERDRIAQFFGNLSKAIFKEKTRGHLTRYLSQVNKVLFTFIASKGIDSLINFFAVTTILLLLGVPYALLFGIISGIANFIPFLGSLFAVLFISVMTFITGGPTQALWALGFLLIFQQMDANFIEPRIMGYSLKISPILVIFAVVVGGAYFGIAGMFLAVPVMVIIKQITLEYISLNLKKKEA
ncbi:AI-2E family transporter [Candidatus Saccharibacteria bacterium]|nr:AI-2E family transporter [Candidatus Saccharibacteria bacterium]